MESPFGAAHCSVNLNHPLFDENTFWKGPINLLSGDQSVTANTLSLSSSKIYS